MKLGLFIALMVFVSAANAETCAPGISSNGNYPLGTITVNVVDPDNTWEMQFDTNSGSSSQFILLDSSSAVNDIQNIHGQQTYQWAVYAPGASCDEAAQQELGLGTTSGPFMSSSQINLDSVLEDVKGGFTLTFNFGDPSLGQRTTSCQINCQFSSNFSETPTGESLLGQPLDIPNISYGIHCTVPSTGSAQYKACFGGIGVEGLGYNLQPLSYNNPTDIQVNLYSATGHDITDSGN